MPKTRSQVNTGEKIMIIIALIAIAIFLMTLKNTTPSMTPTSETMTQPTISSVNDLDNASQQLNSQDLNQINSGLDQLNNESSGF